MNATYPAVEDPGGVAERHRLHLGDGAGERDGVGLDGLAVGALGQHIEVVPVPTSRQREVGEEVRIG